ncbi:MAG: hypothetical protein A2912_02380 [Candidatus Buchananbacteria bacterium RIFCSPLOWO2_01_FULL_40_23b]|uniref:Uncharacterized protein n=1 Tax=Candidatus Buchananbacteria bacterium RIFCSPLOWO2_01_FULL_40_23b TaxID=1797544 RepID=A0A1G1YNG3_9BACT|nr:MAG: hypothetical protein A2912_02380 [Candidatus Buchananbacteria bacterium RIFCSPLOWO2_01_FULL_40_23b]
MINLHQKALEEAKGWEYARLKLFGFDNLPHYSCRNIAEFLENRVQIGVMREVAVPRVVYFPHPKSDKDQLYLPIRLKDESESIEVYVRPHAFHTQSGQPLVNILQDLHQGYLFGYATLRNGIFDPTMFGDGTIDERIYLTGFKWSSNTRGKKIKQKKELSDLLEKLSGWIPEMEPDVVRER